jgi:hypothetical protein
MAETETVGKETRPFDGGPAGRGAASARFVSCRPANAAPDVSLCNAPVGRYTGAVVIVDDETWESGRTLADARLRRAKGSQPS